jgi:hypothetical protein
MNKLILSLLFLIPGAACAAGSNFIANSWFPKEQLLPMLDRCYEDTKHPEVKSAGDLLNNFANELASVYDHDSLTAADKESSKQFIKNYTKYLGVYLCIAQQVLWVDSAMAEYLNTDDVQLNLFNYTNAFYKENFDGMNIYESIEIVEQLLPAELFIAYIFFMSDEHFQKEVEKYTEQIMVTHYSK